MADAPYPSDVQAWIEKAESDLRAARLLLEADPPEPSAAAFHSQQAAEKYLKAVLVFFRAEPPRTHSLPLLLDLLTSYDGTFESLRDRAEMISPLAVRVRYPFAEASPDEAMEALVHAEAIRSVVRSRLDQSPQ